LYGVYAGLTATAIAPVGTTFSVGSFLYLGEEGPSSGVALSYGMGVQLYGLVNIGLGAEWGVYGTLTPDNVYGYEGPFLVGSIGAGFAPLVGWSLNPVWAIDPKALTPFTGWDSLRASARFVGVTFSMALTVLPGPSLTAAVTYSHVVSVQGAERCNN
jgi:hypothetical protein